MLSLAAHTRAALKSRLAQVLSTSLRRPITTRENDTKHGPAFIDNAPGWNEDLATVSEAFVKADRSTTSHDANEMQRLTVVRQSHYRSQDLTEAATQGKEHDHDPDGERSHANYAREEIGGPLGHAGVGEFEGVVGKDDLGPDRDDDSEVRLDSNGRVVTRRVFQPGGPGRGSGPGSGSESGPDKENI